MNALHEALADFMDEWDANQKLGRQRGIGPGMCSVCDRQRYVQYWIDYDASFCSNRCAKKYRELVEMGRSYAKVS